MAEKSYGERFKKLSYAERQRASGCWPVVLRMAGMRPEDVKGMIAHALRKVGDTSHTDPRRRALNEVLIGSNEIGAEMDEECKQLRDYNRNSLRLGKKKDKYARAGDPWNGANNSDGPLREIVLSVHRDHFLADADCPSEHLLEFLDDEGNMARHDLRKHQQFKEAGRRFLVEEFGGSCVYARYDLDEQSGHLHALISDVVQEPASMRYAHGRMLYRTTHHRCVGGVGDERRGYEVAQDVIAAFFDRDEYKHMNVVRGEQRAKAKREVMKELDAALDSHDLNAWMSDGERAAAPEGSVGARRKWMAKKLAAEAASRSGKLRKGAQQDLALDLLELLGALDPQVRHQHQTQRARDELLRQFAESHGTPEELLANADAILVGAVERARASILAAREEAEKDAAAERARKDQEAAARRADLDRIAAEKRAAEDRKAEIRRQFEEDQALRKRLAADRAAEAERQQKQRALAAYEKALGQREAEVDRKTAWLIETLSELRELGSAIRAAAMKLGLTQVPFVREAVAALKKVDELWKGRERER